MKPRLVAALAAPAAVVIALAMAGCSGGGSGGSGGSGSSGGSSSGGGLASCVEGHTWNLDVPDLANQLLTKLQSEGHGTFTSATGTGTQTMKWGTDGKVTVDTNFSFTVNANLSDGIVMSLVQTHSGPAGGTMTISGSTATPSGWDASQYTVANAITINGQSSSTAPVTLPSSDLGSGALELTCSGTTLTTHSPVAGSYATQKWTR